MTVQLGLEPGVARHRRVPEPSDPGGEEGRLSQRRGLMPD